MFTQTHRRILVAPLDWGLGHTARCVPVIAHLQACGHIPIVACNAWQRVFIEKTFGPIDIIDLPGYNITYSRWNQYAQAGLLSQIPGILRTIRTERQWLQHTVQQHRIEGIISDNRYGLYHDTLPSVIMTHQLQIKTGMGSAADRTLQKMHYKYLERFAATWVVDAPGTPNLGGGLSHPQTLPRNAVHMGLLSRFANESAGNESGDIVILLSGPEPQRGELEKILWAQAYSIDRKITFIAGSATAVVPQHIPAHITYHAQLAGAALLSVLKNAGLVVCRSGYSTLMDLVALHKKAILLPTPGQTEQQYLGTHLHTQGIFYCTPQKKFNLVHALSAAQQFPFHIPQLQAAYGIYKDVVDEWVEGL